MLDDDFLERSQRTAEPGAVRLGRAVLVAFLVSSLGGCRDRGVRCLHELRYYAGDVWVEQRVAGKLNRRWSGEATFDRAADNYQLTLRRDDATVSLTRGSGGAVNAFLDGVPCPVAARDAADFAHLMALIEGLPGGAELRRGDSSYEIRLGDKTTVVRLKARRFAHGK